jgi:uncharacterized protein GlcG (DUF336 family)
MQAWTTLDLEDATAAMQAGLRAAAEKGHRMGFAVVDPAGDLIGCCRMTSAPYRLLRHAVRKAYTAAVMGRDTARFGADLADRGGGLDQWGDDRLTTLPGGRVVVQNGRVVGAVACGGAPSEVDEEIAGLMVEALGLSGGRK